MRRRGFFTSVVALVVAATALVGCGKPDHRPVYVSLGDSYAAGFQPTSRHSGSTNRNGFAYQVADELGAAGHGVHLANFGCGGATTASILHQTGCDLLGPDGVKYPHQTQAAAAEAYLRAHRGKVALITVSISGNDVTSCAKAKDPVTCVSHATTTIKRNLATLLAGVRRAAGAGVPIVGITYPDVILGGWVSHSASTRQLATLSVTAFRSLINPTLQAAYTAVGAKFVDVTAATGAYGSLARTTTLPPYGRIPVPVAMVCRLTYFCQYGDIHPRTAGYTLIARLVVRAANIR